MLRLYAAPAAAAMAPHATLAELGVPYELELVERDPEGGRRPGTSRCGDGSRRSRTATPS
jgi:hypothetical protein